MKQIFFLLTLLTVVGHAAAETRVPAGMGVRIIRDDGTIDPGRNRLYTKSDPTAKGGIQGRIASPSLPLESVLAIPADEPRFVYEARIMDDDRRSFYLTGLPMRKYDLIVIYKDRFYEGLRLHRDPNTLAAEDRKKIKTTVDACEPYFKKKFIHRLEGTTGRGNQARAICTFLRDAGSAEGHSEHRRTFKLLMFKDVGPGWQVVRARDLFPVSFKAGKPLPRHNYSEQLGGIRVTRSIKDLGEIKLTR
ncbi:MAG: hypothetical protein ISS31_00640 [Kiritimatiellae bacterium]|nr:hypothetical protein [Kiritimatiellia bacterium]